MTVKIITVTRPVVDYIIDSLSGNFGWDPISSIAPDVVSRFITIIEDSGSEFYDIELSDECKLEAKNDHITLRFREHLATLDSKDFEKVVIV